MCDVVNAEKKLLTIINATVSHEMRNPTNCIMSQNLLQIQLNEQINELIYNKEITSIKKIKKKLK